MFSLLSKAKVLESVQLMLKVEKMAEASFRKAGFGVEDLTAVLAMFIKVLAKRVP